MNETLGLVLNTFAVAGGAFALLVGLLEIVTSIQESRPVWTGVALTVVGLALLVPVFWFAMRDAIAEAKSAGRM